MQLLDTSAFGLPLHPLVVHAVVVLLPLGALGILACLLVPKLRTHYLPVAVGLAAIATASAVVAKFSGEALSEATRLPAEHSDWGNRTLIAAVLLLIFSGVWWFLGRRRADGGGPSTAERVSGGLAGLAALAATILVVLAGHSGSESVWMSRLEAYAVPAAPTAPADRAAPDADDDAVATTTPAPGEQTYSLAEVRANDAPESCWAIVDGDVFNLTEWITRHPGGPQRIANLCGTDATQAFANQHGAADRPNTALEQFRIGVLA
ncbi:MAG: cytochrome b5-like heme/steroid binding domain-containing protein [Propionibacteriaceae bacterium]|nr:cytochrome b5-like heme/steroid binding domain-containing protein [Propionibacteriaceae bacterium]